MTDNNKLIRNSTEFLIFTAQIGEQSGELRGRNRPALRQQRCGINE